MAKAPAIQFYVRDWLSDPELQSASLVSRGAWIQCLCFMWENSKRGELTRTPLKFARLMGGTLDEALHFLNEIYEYEFGDILVDENVTFPLHETDCNINVTVRNRRMWSDYKDRQNTRLRVKKHRQKTSVTEKKQENNADVTLTSSSSSSSSRDISKDISAKADFFRDKIHPYFESIERSCKIISKLPSKNFNPYQYTNQQINKIKAHPGAVDEILRHFAVNWETVNTPHGLAKHMMEKLNGNYWEREHIEDYEQVKTGFTELCDKFKDIIPNIGKKIDKKGGVI